MALALRPPLDSSNVSLGPIAGPEFQHLQLALLVSTPSGLSCTQDLVHDDHLVIHGEIEPLTHGRAHGPSLPDADDIGPSLPLPLSALSSASVVGNARSLQVTVPRHGGPLCHLVLASSRRSAPPTVASRHPSERWRVPDTGSAAARPRATACPSPPHPTTAHPNPLHRSPSVKPTPTVRMARNGSRAATA